MKIQKRKFCFAIAIALTMLLSMLPSVQNVDAASRISLKESATINSVKLKWKKKKVSYYVIYRFNVTNFKELDEVPEMSDYKKIVKVKKTKTTYSDKKVKANNYYSYVICGYKKSGKKYKVAYTSYDDYSYDYICPGLTQPMIYNAGYGEFAQNSSKELNLYIERDHGVAPSKYLIYRKAANETNFKKIGEMNAKYNDYSIDGQTWLSIGEDGIELRANDTLFYKFALTPAEEDDYDAEETQVNCLHFNEEAVKYLGSGIGYEIMELNLESGEGRAHLDWN